MDFYQSINEALYSRMEEGTGASPLEECSAYKEAFARYKVAAQPLKDRKAAEELDRAVDRLGDLKAQFYYRLGLQDGVSLTARDFPARGIE